MLNVTAPKDPQTRRNGFYVLLDQKIGGEPQSDGTGRQPIFLDGGRLSALAKIVGGLDERLAARLDTAEGFRQIVHSIGVSAQAADPAMEIGFTLAFYEDAGPGSGSRWPYSFRADGTETVFSVPELPESDRTPGQFLFTLPTDRDLAEVTVKFYLQDGFDAPDLDPDSPVDRESRAYRDMIARSFLSGGNNRRVKEFLRKLRCGQKVTIAYLGGSITQGAGAVPAQEMCYARRSFEAIRDRYASDPGQVRYLKAGVGGTPSQLGILRYDRDIGRDGTERPDLVVIEFAVNDGDDETNGVCYESLVRKILDQPQHPAVILLFSVFANDWNLKDRLAPIGFRYQLPMADVLEAVSPQFSLPKSGGRVLSKRQYFYDVYHPTNTGHQVMADCLLYLLDRLDRQMPMPPEPMALPLYGTDYASIRLLDRKDGWPDVQISPGGFTRRDIELQSVLLDDDTENTPQFPYNWQKGKDPEPFVLEIACKSLMLIFKDSENPAFGKAEVREDGVLLRTLDPRAVNWTHCHAALLFQGTETRRHKIEISMAPADEEKTFTILGFGFVP